MNRVKVFIDNSNVYKCLLEQSIVDPKWKKQYDPLFLSQILVGDRDLVGVNFYCTNPPPSLRKANPKAFASQESYYSRVENLEKVIIHFGNLTTNDGKYFEKNLDTQMVVDIMEGAYQDHFDTLILVSSDGDFESTIRKVKEIGKRVEILFFRGHVSQNLKKVSDVNRRARRSYFKQL
ncbi:MAG: NYN domain-containing protein [Candidatus Dojkabacteria bacterium]|nr:NYN domain-containing protein [Candidatus Dojkabacteria bacterium]